MNVRRTHVFYQLLTRTFLYAGTVLGEFRHKGEMSILTEDFLGCNHPLGTPFDYRHARLERVK